ncbi:thioredoxin domain-containing protein [Pyxidicoccus parkwayensis]|uniref:Thioredoxin domain-containing protein n=1 Tax=Pyxidicoccus parkwayensis TaxID=2813578 RepID=A0ABX7NTB3_9BACT|nr:thioredoxin domain-containing protein [Pyxidicoccus parkwaysis]QSQ21718.1 thioredoxin domain-containing protein [Pyxidicoccus parkwaysis]
MSKASVWVSLSVGLVLGFVGGRAGRPGDASANAVEARGAPAAAKAPGARQRPPISPTVYKVPLDGSPSLGAEDALVTVVEFSDYECPFCSRAHATVKQLQEKYGKKLRVVMKQHPLDIHAHAKSAALAALAAGEQGKFWEMHDTLFTNARALGAENLERYARELGLDVARWKKDMGDARLVERVRKEEAQALQLGANGTPAFFINGRYINGAQPLEVFTGVVDEELGKAEALVKGGVRPAEVYARVIEKGVERPPAQPAQQAQQELPVQKVEVGNAPARGPANAPVTVVAFSDFECPFCARAVPTLKALEEEYGGKLRVAFKHQPLPMHPHAKLAAAASMAAHEQGKFWEMHDLLFANQRQLDREALEGYAKQLGLNEARFKAALDSGKFDSQLTADMSEGTRVGAGATPTFFINGRPVVGAMPIDHFRRIIDEELKKSGVAAR